MTLTINTEQLDQHQALLTVAVAEERIQQAFQQKVRSLAREVQIPGFRPGKAPLSFVIKRLGAEAIRSEVLDELLPTILQEALEQSELDVYDAVRMEDFVLEPTSFKVLLALSPTVEIGDYREMRQEMPEISISDEAIVERLEHLRAHHELLEPVDRPSELGDVVVVSGDGRLLPVAGETTGDEPDVQRADEAAEDDREVIFNGEQTKVLLDAEKSYPHTPLVENLVGVSVGDTIKFQFNFADDYDDEHLRGREAQFSLEIVDVNRRELPEVDDELARLEGEYETLDELKEAIREELAQAAQEEAESDLFDQFIDGLLATAQLNYPPLMVEQEAEAFKEGIEKELKQLNVSWAQYQEMMGEDLTNVQEKWLAEAEERVKRHLILRELITQEKLSVNQDDMMALLQERLSHYENPEIRNYILSMYLEGDRGRELHNEALSNKVRKRVVAILTGQAPDLDALDEEE